MNDECIIVERCCPKHGWIPCGHGCPKVTKHFSFSPKGYFCQEMTFCMPVDSLWRIINDI